MLEDNPVDAELVVQELRRAGFAPSFRRVETEPEYLLGLEDLPDVVLADVNLPQFNGLRALDLLRQRGRDIPCLLVSRQTGDDLAVEALKHGADDFLPKDQLGRLGEAVRRALEQRRLRRERKQLEEQLLQSQKMEA